MNRIAEVTSLSRKQFKENFFSKSIPFVFRAGLSDSNVCDKWTWEYFKSEYGEKTVEVFYSEKNTFSHHSAGTSIQKKMNLKEFIECLFDPSTKGYYYLQQTSLSNFSNKLEKEIYPPKVNDSIDKFRSVNIWIGKKGCITPLHFDSRDNFLCQVRGRKKVIIYAPDQTKYLYANPQRPRHISLVDINNVDDQIYPLYSKAQAYYCEIGEGDVLFIPRKWWHHVTSLENSISVNYWWTQVTYRKILNYFRINQFL